MAQVTRLGLYGGPRLPYAGFTDRSDVTAPVLSLPTGTKTGSTTASGTVSTDEGNGTLYFWATTSATESAADIITNGDSQTVVATGVQNVSFTGLTAGTVYYAHYVHDDAASNESNVVNSTAFTTDSEDTGTAGGGSGTARHFGAGYDYDEPVVVAIREEIKQLRTEKRQVKKQDNSVAMLLAIEERLKYLYELLEARKVRFLASKENYEYQARMEKRAKRTRRLKTIMRLLN